MQRPLIPIALVVLALLFTVPLFADPSATSVGLGFSVGAAFPQGSTAGIPNTDGQPSFDWGFYVNIPLVSTFHLTPSSELYKFNMQNATDVDLAFKFIVPLGSFDLYAGVSPGLTTVADVLAPHVGILGGAAFRLISNLDAFVQAKYCVLFQGSQNMGIFHLTAGMLFAF
jgi:hypothetical protein